MSCYSRAKVNSVRQDFSSAFETGLINDGKFYFLHRRFLLNKETTLSREGSMFRMHREKTSMFFEMLQRFWKEDLYGSANDPRTANDPGPQMIPDRK